ncbi:MAG: hypothetical protein J6J05_09805 [Peptococcaceae bacterium]|nr:hypothetical protein [Peptococcaceae bacterium]MBP3626103.1 hypothetical protein [Peptococcaceae bacterium]
MTVSPRNHTFTFDTIILHQVYRIVYFFKQRKNNYNFIFLTSILKCFLNTLNPCAYSLTSDVTDFTVQRIKIIIRFM